MAAKLTRLTHKIATQLQLVAESCTICSSPSRRPVWKLLDTPSYAQNLSLLQCRVLTFIISQHHAYAPEHTVRIASYFFH
jgi:hypothetical protein